MPILTQAASQAPGAAAPLPPVPPPLPPLPPSPAAITTSQGLQQLTIPVPRTAADLRALREQREELSNQLISAVNRRENLAREWARADGAAKAGIEGRMAILDQRIIQLEADIASTGRVLTSTEAGRLMAQGSMASRVGDRGADEAMGFGIAIGFGIAFAMMGVRRIFRRRRDEAHLRAIGHDPQQLARLEQAVDAIAIEVERIAEGQRFTSKLMADSVQRAKSERATI
jgi:hypothetical protein